MYLKIKNVHIELTSRCNAECPMCSRTSNPLILDNQDEITLPAFKSFFPVEFLNELDQIKFCGNFGDPAVAKDILKIHEYIYTVNPNIRFVVNTNGGVRGVKFWTDMGRFYSKANGAVTFHIDGLEDTNHIYRSKVKWKKVIENLKAFNQAGGKSVWAFIPFFHNEHQVEEAEQLSKELGCIDFAVKITARFSDYTKPFIYSQGDVTKKIYPPVADRFNIKEMVRTLDKPQCVAKDRSEIYVDSWGRVAPCCWIASNYVRDRKYLEKMQELNNSSFSLYENSIDDILNGKYFQIFLPQSWESKLESPVCYNRCAKIKSHVWEKNGEKHIQRDLFYFR